MQIKMLGSLLSASLVAFSASSFAQGTAPSGQDTPREAATTTTPAPAGAPAVVVDSASAGASRAPSFRCDTLAGDERVRCMQTYSWQQGMGIYTQRPGDSGPGAIDKLHPGLPSDVAASRDAGTSSAGSP